MLGRKTRLRPHIGKMPMKFIFRAQDITVSLPGLDVAGKLVLVWKRGARRTPTQPFEVKETLSSIDGSLTRSAATPQDLALICTVSRLSLERWRRFRLRPARHPALPRPGARWSTQAVC